MSGPIRRLLGPTKARLQGYIKKAAIILEREVDDDLDREETELDDLIHRFSTNITLLERCNQEWTTLLNLMETGDDKAAEEKEYLWASDGDGGLIELLLDSKETVARLEARLARVLRKAERAAMRPLTSPLLTTRGNPTEAQTDNSVKVKLPKLNLPTFDGDILQWQEFWDVYKSAVHEQELPDVTKFNYLKSSVCSAAATAISGISVTSDNYSSAVKILKDKFGKTENIIEALYSKLQHLSMATNRFSEIKHNYETIEKMLRQLESQGENVNDQRMLVQQLLSKFPVEVIIRLEESKEVEQVWTVRLVRESLKRYILIHENAQRHDTNSRGSQTKGQRRSDSSYKPPSESQGYRAQTVETFLVGSKKSQSRKPMYPCIFCKGSHFNDNCDKVKTVVDRKRLLASQGRCFVCLKVGHLFRECTSNQSRSCCYCGTSGHHNRCICPKKFSLSPETMASNQLPTGASTMHLKSVLSSETTAVNQSAADGEPVVGNKETIINTDTVTQALSTEHMLLASGERVILQTALVPIYCSNGSIISARLLLDSASQRTFMTERLAKKLGLPSQGKETLSISTFSSQCPQTIDTYVVHFTVITKENLNLDFHANVLTQITSPIQRGPLQPSDLRFLQSISPEKLADTIPDSSDTAAIDVLIGSDYFWSVVDNERIVLPSGLFLLSSKFGYLLTGKFVDPNSNVKHANQHLIACLFMTQMNQCVPELNLFSAADSVVVKNPNLTDMWRLDIIGISDPVRVDDNDKALQQFNEQIYHDGERYQIRWPWKNPAPDLPDNYDVAYGRIKSLSRRFQADRTLLQKYNEVLQSQLKQGIIEKVTERAVDHKTHYLPHHPVLTPSKNTTKVRIVYDASAKSSKSANCLNDCLYRGPVTLPDLCGVLLRLRTYPIVILADVEKAFLQIGIQQRERDVTRFLWFRDPQQPDQVEGNIEIYRFCRVPFGIVCSPFLLEGTLKFHLRSENSSVANKIVENLYVDNVTMGANSVDEAHQLFTESKNIFRKVSMNLREWISNSQEFLDGLPDDQKTKGCVVKLFGMLWNRIEDYIQINDVNIPSSNRTITKREVLSYVARIYDPLGLITPVTFHGKLFLQSLWKCELSWDEALPQLLCQEYWMLTRVFEHLSLIKIPRFIGVCEHDPIFEVLVFCDASMKAYATAVYLRVLTRNGTCVRLVFSKMRLAPVSTVKKKKNVHTSDEITLPRLELLGVVIGVRAANFVVKELKLLKCKRYLWTDSECVLYWLKTSKLLPLFVENRIKEIRMQKDITFCYIPSKQNPADYATRGLTVHEIVDCHLWWYGPEWLRSEQSTWPNWNIPDITPDKLVRLLEMGKKGSKVIYEATNVVQDGSQVNDDYPSPFLMDEFKYSSLRRLLRITVFCIKFIYFKVVSKCSKELTERIFAKHRILKKLFSNVRKGSIYSEEIQNATLPWLYVIQHRKYSDVFIDIEKNRKNCIQQQLGIKIDDIGLLRCHGRLNNADVNEDTKYPKLLPKFERFTNLLIEEVHRRLIHAGVSHTLSQIREEFWIPQGRMQVRHVISECLICRRHEGPSFQLPNMPPWPRERVSRSDPFQYVGLDYLGPLYVKQGTELKKVWICLFTCLSIRAVHMEWILDLTAIQFLNCLRRFVARRGKPDSIISDNAPQFRLTSTALDKQWRQVLKSNVLLDYIAMEGIKWCFTTALAPWQGGFYERLVGMVKRSLRKATGRKHFTLEQMITLITEIEAILNSRPLTYVYGDFLSGFVLTPAHFIVSNRKLCIGFFTDDDHYDDPEFRVVKDSATSLIEYWKKGQRHLNTFWKSWRDEYLLSLRERTLLEHRQPRLHSKKEPTEGSIIIVKDDNIPRSNWRIGKILRLIVSGDSKIRSAEIQLPGNVVMTRPVNHLYPLEVPEDSGDIDVPVNTDNFVTEPDVNKNIDSTPSQPEPIELVKHQRKAATQARSKIQKYLNDNFSTILFCFPRECREND